MVIWFYGYVVMWLGVIGGWNCEGLRSKLTKMNQIHLTSLGRTKVQLKILQAVSDLVDTHYPSFNALHITHLLDSLERMTQTVHCLNTRGAIWEEFGKYAGI